MPTIREYVKQKAQLPFVILFASIAALAIGISLLGGTKLEWIPLLAVPGIFLAIVLLHFRCACPRCHIPFRSALGGVIFNYGMLGFTFCPNCGCKLDERI